MLHSMVAGTGSYLPARVLTNKDIEQLVDTTHEWIVERTGIHRRHIAADHELTSDLAEQAARRAMDAAGVTAVDVDLIIVATSTPDMVFPSTACLVQAKLGIGQGAAFDLQAVCSGFVYALTTADKFVRSGSSKCALVIGAEIFSRLLDWSDRRTCVLFGDGAGAVVLMPSTEPGILSTHIYSDGTLSGILRVPGQISGGKIVGNAYIEMEGPVVFKQAVKVLGEVAREAMQVNGLTAAEVDWLVPHQANIRIIEATAEKMGLPGERIVKTVADHGNTSAASIPLALDTAVRDGRIQRGQNILFEAVGGGMTWGSMLVRW